MTTILIIKAIYIIHSGRARPHNFGKFEGPVLNCRGGTQTLVVYVNELVIHEIRNNASAICCKIEFVQLW
jgi:protein tyrosine phosphatase (PTP) superfamily phosphohydrolase (DUF442 family)